MHSLTYLLIDPFILGCVAWFSLALTVAGFSTALFQIFKIKNASAAASAAVVGLGKMVRSQELSFKVTDALNHLTSAQSMMRQPNPEAAVARLHVGWTTLMSARELAGSPSDREEIGDYVVAVKRLLDDINHPFAEMPPSDELAGRRYEEISQVIGGLGMMSARLSMLLLGIGTER